MEQLNTEKINEEINKILLSNNLPQDLKNKFKTLISNDYTLADLNENDIKSIMQQYNLLELKIIKKLDDNPDTILKLNILKQKLLIEINRSREGFFSKLRGKLN